MNLREQIEYLLAEEYGAYSDKMVDKLLNLHIVICTTRRDNLIAKTESMQQFAKESYKEEYSRVVESDMRNMRIHINKEFINDCI